MKYQSVLYASMKLQHQRLPPPPHLPQEPKNPVFFFFSAMQPCLSSVSTLLTRQKPLMIQESRWRDGCQQNWEEKKTKKHFVQWLTSLDLFYYSCDVRPDTLMPETVASHFGWCSSLVICVSLPANHLAERSIINLSVNHSSHDQWCRMSVGGSEADMCWPHVQLWHVPLCSLASWWVLCVGKAFVIPATQVWALWRRSEHARKHCCWLGDISKVKVWGASSAILSGNRTYLSKMSMN